MRPLINKAADQLSAWYEKNHYHPELHKATKAEVDAANQSIDTTLDKLDWGGMLAPLHEYMAKIYQTGQDVPKTGGYRPFNLNFVKPDPTAIRYAEHRSAELVGKRILDDGTIIDNPDPKWAVTPKLREDIKNTVEEALKNEPSPQELANKIRSLSGFNRARAINISRTELAFAYNYGHQDQALAMGYTQKRSLLGSLHKQPDECDQNADYGWIPASQLFPTGDPCPPYHPSCVCDLDYRRHPNEAESTDAEQSTPADIAQEVTALRNFQPSTPERPATVKRISSYAPLKDTFDKAAKLNDRQYNKFVERLKHESTTWTKEQQDAIKDYALYETASRINRSLDEAFGERRAKVEDKFKEHAKEKLKEAAREEINSPAEQAAQQSELSEQQQEESEASAILAIESLFVMGFSEATEVYEYFGGVPTDDQWAVYQGYADDSSQLVSTPLYLANAGFSSVAADPHTVAMAARRRTAHQLVLHTVLPRGTTVLPLLAGESSKRELLLKPGAVHRVVNIIQIKNTIYVDAVYLPRAYLDDLVEQPALESTAIGPTEDADRKGDSITNRWIDSQSVLIYPRDIS
ncbi:MAG: hypothetical protein ACRD34_00200 [Bryobacteraceae bacterium]